MVYYIGLSSTALFVSNEEDRACLLRINKMQKWNNLLVPGDSSMKREPGLAN